MRAVILALLLSAAAWGQPVNPPPAILKGNPPGGAGGACVAANRIGYLTSSGTQYLCPSTTNVWTATSSGGGDLTINNSTTSGIALVGDPLLTTPFVSRFATFTYSYLGYGGEFVGIGLNDLDISNTSIHYTGAAPAAFRIKINSAGVPDTIVWSKDNGAFSSPVNITGSAQTLGTEGLSVTFGATTGHTAGDYWVIPTAAGIFWPATLSESGKSGATAALGSGAGSVTNGAHAVIYTWASSTGETYSASAGTVTVANNAVNGKISITSLPQSTSALWLGTNIWITKAGGSTYYLAAFLPRGVTSYTFNSADSALTHAAPAYLDAVTTAGGCLWGEVAGLSAGGCPIQLFDYGARFPVGGAGRPGAYFFDGFPNGILGTVGNFLRQITALPDGTTATTQASSDSSTKVATTAFVNAAVGGANTGLVLVEQHTASTSASLDFSSCISSTYDEYEVDLVNLLPASTSSLLYRVATTGSFDSGNNYASAYFRLTRTGNAGGGTDAGSGIDLTVGANTSTTAANGGYSGSFKIFNPAGQSAAVSRIVGQGGYNNGGTPAETWANYEGVYNTTGNAITKFQIIASTGNLASGTVRCYGVAK